MKSMNEMIGNAVTDRTLALRINVDGSVVEVRPANESCFTPNELSAMVGGEFTHAIDGSGERVVVALKDPDSVFLAGKEDDRRCQINSRASYILRQPVYGDVVFGWRETMLGLESEDFGEVSSVEDLNDRMIQ